MIERPSGRTSRRILRGSIVLALAALVIAGAWVASDNSRAVASSPGALRIAPSMIPTIAPVPSTPAPAITLHIPHPTWVNVTSDRPAAAPPPATGVASAYDPVDNETVEFGGCLAVGPCPDNQTWVLRDGLWSNETQHADAPSSRDYAAMDYDANLRALLLFGGEGINSTLNDTWMFSNGTWTNVTWYSTAAPPAENSPMMAFDPQPEENGSVLFGGCLPGTFLTLNCSNETWIWEGDAGWVELTPSAPPPGREDGQMAYDPLDGALVLFGGVYGFLGLLGDTWEFYDDQWWNVTTSVGPGVYATGGLVYDPSEQELVLFGGINSSFDFANETWTWVNGTWSKQSPSLSPPARGTFAIALDSTGTNPIIEGGENDTITYNDTWVYEFPPTAELGANVTTPEVTQSVGFTTTIFDGTPPYREIVSFGDGTDATIAGDGSTLAVDHTFERSGVFDTSVTVTDSDGASYSVGGPTITVGAAPAVTAAATPSTTDVDVPVDFASAIVSDAAPPFVYAWNFGDLGSGSGAAPAHTYTSPGTYNVTLTATNAAHATATARVVVTVVAAPAVTVAASSTDPGVGATVTFYGNVTGGVGPLSYSWHFGDGATSALPYPQHAFAGGGSYEVEVWVNDSVGGSTHATLHLSVGAASSALFPPLGGAPTWFWAALGAIAAVGVVGIALLVRRAGKRPRAP